MKTAEQSLINSLPHLRRRFPVRHRLDASPTCAVALLNVGLLLLMFFLLNDGFVLQPGVSIDLPTAPFRNGAPFDSVVLTVTQEGLLFLDDERTAMTGLQAELESARHRKPGAALLVEADGRVRNSVLMDIYNLAVSAGFTKVEMAARVP